MSAGRGCPVGWCDELDQHAGPHRRILLDTLAFDLDTGTVPLRVTVQGESARLRVTVLTVGECETGLTWTQVDQLAGVLTATRRSYGGP